MHVLDARPTMREQVIASSMKPEALWFSHTCAEHVMSHLRRAGRAVIMLRGRHETGIEPGEDLVIASPLFDPGGLRKTLSAGKVSRVICCFDEREVGGFLAGLDMYAPGRETLLRCHRTLLDMGSTRRKIGDYASALGQRGVARAGAEGTLAERSLAVFREIGLVSIDGDEVTPVRLAGRADLATSTTFRETQAWRADLERFYNLIGRSPQVLAEWLGSAAGVRSG
jgi:hypothetical protein